MASIVLELVLQGATAVQTQSFGKSCAGYIPDCNLVQQGVCCVL